MILDASALDTPARNDRMAETMLKLHAKSGTLTADSSRLTACSLRPGVRYPNTERIPCGSRTVQAAFRARGGYRWSDARVTAISAPIGTTDRDARGVSPIIRSGKALWDGSGMAL